MLEDFLLYIEFNLSVIREDKILLAISGGVDSMVMLHLFRELAFNIEVVHINHSTRNGKSDEDMAFVEAYCKAYSLPFHSKTLKYEKLKKGNFQENARNARFSFLYEIKNSRNCDWISTAHHKDDRWETFLMHLNRKSGIKGLTSLRAKDNDIIHPLLAFTKKQIVQYANENNIRFVVDESNESDDYLRNSIRHHVTPAIAKLYPDFIENVNQSIAHLDNASKLIKELIDHQELKSTDQDKGYVIVNTEKIKAFKNQKDLLYFIIEQYGFNFSNAKEILETETTGAKFDSKQHEGIYDRGKFIIRKKKKQSPFKLTINAPGVFNLRWEKKLNVKINPALDSEKHLWLDNKNIEWPLTIRNVQPGDRFKPQGMKGASKSLKKFCTDLKLNRFDKEDLLLVCKDNIILQVIGFRSAHEYTTSDIKNALTFNIVD